MSSRRLVAVALIARTASSCASPAPVIDAPAIETPASESAAPSSSSAVAVAPVPPATSTSQPVAVTGAEPEPPAPPTTEPPLPSGAGPLWSDQKKKPAASKSVGIKACDDYLALLEKCFAEQPAVMAELLETSREAYKNIASQGGTAVIEVGRACGQAADALRPNCPVPAIR